MKTQIETLINRIEKKREKYNEIPLEKITTNQQNEWEGLTEASHHLKKALHCLELIDKLKK